MSVLFVCDGCDVRAPGGWLGETPDGWVRRCPANLPGVALHACNRPSCRDKIAAMKEAPPEPLPH